MLKRPALIALAAVVALLISTELAGRSACYRTGLGGSSLQYPSLRQCLVVDGIYPDRPEQSSRASGVTISNR